MTDPLSRLTRGLSEDERIARAASDLWHADVVKGVDVEGTVGSAAYDHITRFSPKRALDTVEALRPVVSFCASMYEQTNDVGYREILALLASIYPEDTDDTEKP
ncbi:DUF6221 family protein [Nocardia abscessus]|uniref:DUF6221 family protein n=1 Tax=Nocardia abscessus TaxID=120957 RepID=UPI002454CADB|nr:DUF6221 family protein [Nocardia abscessus]